MLIGCISNEPVKKYYSNGTIKEHYFIDKGSLKTGIYKYFHKNGTVKEQRLYKEGVIIDTIRYFDRNGVLIGGSYNSSDSIYTFELQNDILFKEGMNKRKATLDEKEFNGWIKYYNDGILEKKIYYKYIEGKGSVINKYYKYNSDNEKINKNESFYFSLKLPDTVFINNRYRFNIDFNSNATRTVGFFSIFSDKINSNFENIYNLDTIYSEKYPVADFKLNDLGQQTLRGKFTEQFLLASENKSDTTKIDVTVNYRDFYYEKKIYVVNNSLKTSRKNESLAIH